MGFISKSPPAGLKERAGRSAIGHPNLERMRLLALRLVTDDRMPRVWHELRKRLEERGGHESQLEILCFEVDDAHRWCRHPPRKRAELAERFMKAARHARVLAKLVEDSRLDDTVYRLYTEEAARKTLGLIRGTDWREEPTQQQIAVHSADWFAKRYGIPVATAYLDCVTPRFPTLATLLEAVAAAADKAAKDAMNEPRVVNRPGAGNYTVNYFVRRVAAHLREHFGGEMRRTLATLASVALAQDINEKTVANALRHEG